MFDVFKWAAQVKGSKSTTIKAFGATMKCEGLPTSHTIEGYEALLGVQATIPTVSLPKSDANEHVGDRCKVNADSIDPLLCLIRGEYVPADQDDTKKEPAKARKAREKAEAEAAEAAKGN